MPGSVSKALDIPDRSILLANRFAQFNTNPSCTIETYKISTYKNVDDIPYDSLSHRHRACRGKRRSRKLSVVDQMVLFTPGFTMNGEEELQHCRLDRCCRRQVNQVLSGIVLTPESWI
jgi:hypothetical protein